MRIPSMGGATAKGSRVSLPGGRQAGRARSGPPSNPSGENEQEVELKDDEMTSGKSPKVKQTTDPALETSKT